MAADRLSTINVVSEANVGTPVGFVGVITAVRCLGKVTFVVVRDTSSEVQVVVAGDLQKVIADRPPPFYATIQGVLGARPQADVRRDSPNGGVEVQATDLCLHIRGEQPLARPRVDWRFDLADFLQSRGFKEANTLASLYAPSYADLLRSEDALGAAKQLACALGPCQWYLITPKGFYFGSCPSHVSELKVLVQVEEDSTGAGWCDALAETSWFDEHSAGEAPAAYGTIECASPEAPVHLVNTIGYWRSRYAISHLRDDLVALAARRPKLDDGAVRILQERLDRGQALLTAISGPGKRASIAPILRDLEEFDLHVEHTEVMLALFPSLEKKLARVSGDEQFELLWSILGHDHVKEVFSSPEAVERLTACVAAGMFTDFNVLRTLDPDTLESIHALTQNLEHTASVELISEMFAVAPGASASACYLMRELARSGAQWQRCVSVAQRGVISRLAFTAAAHGVASAEDISSWRAAVAHSSRFLFRNDPVDEAACWASIEASAEKYPWIRGVLDALPREGVVFDLIHLTYGHGLVAYDEASRMYAATSDCSDHWASAGFKFAGDRWNAAEGRFELTGLWLYPSKNRGAILSKSCSGICSARNMGLFHRADHFQFTLVNPSTLVACGSLQMYDLHRTEEQRLWVVRGLNPSEKVEIDPLGFSYEVLDTLASMAHHSEVDTLACADGVGLFSADSSRVSVRAILRRSETGARKVPFAAPLHIFDYHGRPVSIDHGWQIWP